MEVCGDLQGQFALPPGKEPLVSIECDSVWVPKSLPSHEDSSGNQQLVTEAKEIKLSHVFSCCMCKVCAECTNDANPLNTKRRLLYFKAQSVPRNKHFSSRL